MTCEDLKVQLFFSPTHLVKNEVAQALDEAWKTHRKEGCKAKMQRKGFSVAKVHVLEFATECGCMAPAYCHPVRVFFKKINNCCYFLRTQPEKTSRDQSFERTGFLKEHS